MRKQIEAFRANVTAQLRRPEQGIAALGWPVRRRMI